MSPNSTGGPLSVEGVAPHRRGLRDRLIALLYGALFVVFTTLTLTVQWPLGGRFVLESGDVSPDDIRAPQSIEYISEIRTEQARLEAERRVSDVYEPQRKVRTEQVRRGQDIMDYIESVRADALAAPEERLALLQAIPDLQIAEQDWALILSLDDAAWERVSLEVPDALNIVMLGEIRDSQLASAKRKVPTYIDLVSDDEAQAAIVLVQSLIRPNALYNTDRTEALRQEARNSVEPQTGSYEQNEIIVRQGDLVTPLHIEALNALGLNEPGFSWWRLVQALALSMVMATIFGLSFLRTSIPSLEEPRRLGLLLALLATFLFLAKVMVPGQGLLAFVFPLAALTMLIYPLLGVALTFLVTAYFAVIVALLSGGSVDIIVYAIVGPLIGALVLGRADRTSTFVKAGAAVAAANSVVLMSLNLPPQELDLANFAQLAAAAVVSGGLAASLTLIGFYLLGAIFDIATPLRLMELARPNHPLLRDLIMKTPGTYHHSILVANLAEQGAEAVGADAFLTRVGSYYHDIGKMVRPHFFVENRLEGTSPHDQLDSWSSAQIIISHVKDGLEMARRYKLPRRVRDFIAEHQGTGLVRYFYHEAQKKAGPDQVVDERDFRYPGPKPQSKETAILMLADSCEGAVRAARPGSKEEIDEVVRKIINQRLIEGELSDSDLTLRDLETIRVVFVRLLEGVHHPRIKYPEPAPQFPVSTANEQQQPQPTAAS